MKDAALLAYLSETFTSGSVLAQRLGLSRVAVWKQAHRLQAAGYPVEVVQGQGYRLRPGSPAPHLLHARLQGRFGRAYRYLGRTTSTQDALRAWAEAGAPEGAVVLAEQQTRGRGRRGRSWVSPPGAGLYFSVLLRPRLPLTELLRLSLAAGIALAETAEVGGLKWPNDLLAPDGRKLAGVLVEAELRGEEVRFLLLGIGLNVHAAPLPPEATYLEAYRPGLRRVDLLAKLLARLEYWSERLTDAAAICTAWSRYSYTLGRPVRIDTPAGLVEGVAEALASSGALQVRLADGTLRTISAGDVALLSPVSANHPPNLPA
ncbi:biotin--[acetyl-CoA-carboxylase] ligase [Rhodothermus profundi]|uniref:Bifunctional ligase/repressor BirA n=1 Tax=Rhodothermus profundi TaxID=633813 RepID=A0A1M6XTQ0_9BACT|nr:biotin--[acetyl-CoA-carboxylase] ligase [Rhodothermus profundi]SHL09243.1 BirA family transcriptional regulator, biotin operon repressor / biotin-[acetyl-CoA-carboxylase] ligase [Rhodothermus profundi]